MKTLLWLVAVVLSGGIGFYFGTGVGAQALNAIAAQNEVSDGVYRLSVSLDALGQNDLERANHAHEQNLKSALVQIGTYSKAAYVQCSEKDRNTINAAQSYVLAHPDILSGPLHEFQSQALQLCAQTNGGA
jgi:hypothetical protein